MTPSTPQHCCPTAVRRRPACRSTSRSRLSDPTPTPWSRSSRNEATDPGGETAVSPDYYLYLSAILFTIGATGVLVRRNAIVVFMCIELMLNAVNLSLVTFSRIDGTLD